MAENALDVLAREREEEENNTTPKQPLPPSYQTPTSTEISEKGGLQPITAETQAREATGGDNQMAELKAWKQLAPGTPGRNEAREAWHQKYTGRSYEEFAKKNFIEQGMLLRSQNDKLSWQEPWQVGNAMAQGIEGFAVDVIGMLPGGDKFDDWYDEHNTYKSPTMRGISDFSSLVIPGMYGGKMATNLLSKAPWLAKAMGVVATDVAITGLSDVSERDETLTSMAVDMFPNIVGPKGWIPVPEVLINKDSDSPEVTKYRNMLEAGGLPVVGNALGFAFTQGGQLYKKGHAAFSKAYQAQEKRIMGWFVPKTKNAEIFKSDEIAKAANPKKVMELAKIDESIASGMANKSEMKLLLQKKEALLKDLDRWDSIEHFDSSAQQTIDRQSKKAAIDKIEADPNNLDFDPDITPGISPDSVNARQSVRPGNVARNMVDITTNEIGITKGDPVPIVPNSVLRKVAKAGGTARDITLDVAAKGLKASDFDAKVMGLRVKRGEMSEAAFGLLGKYLNAPNGKALKKMFLDKKNVYEGVKYLDRDQQQAALAAYQILNDRYLGRDVAETSARLMETFGAEISTFAETAEALKGVADPKRLNYLMREKLKVLWPEYRMTEFVWGTMGNDLQSNANNLIKKSPEQINQIVQKLKNAENAFHAKAQKLTKTLAQLEETNPEFMSPLSRAFEMSKGDVNTQAGLLEWSAKKLDPKGLVVSPEFGGSRNQLNVFASSTWSYVYNNVLSGLSTFRAMIGNGKELANKPLNAVLGHIAQIPAKGFEFEKVKKMWYYYGAVQETNKRALSYMWDTIKKVDADPDAMMDAFRKDYSPVKRQEWQILDEMAEVYRQTDDIGHLMQYDAAKLMDAWSRTRYARYGMTGMSGVDAYTTSYMGTLHARMRAYDEVLTTHGKIDNKLLKLAEEKHYKSMFDSKGMLTDAAVKNATGEIALNLDSAAAKVFTDATTAVPAVKPILMFPRSGTNAVRLALSYTPLVGITPLDKYGKTIWAVTDEQIDTALKAHGLSLQTPNARNIFENLKTEYIGRQVFSTVLVNRLWAFAMDGNIRGNGHYNGQRRVNERREFLYEPLTIKIPGTEKWISYRGIPGVQQVLSILGDISYYSKDFEQPIMEDFQRKLMWTLSASFFNETPLGGLEPLTAIATGDFTGFERIGGNTLRSGIPFSGAAGVLQQSIDSAQRDLNKDITEYARARVPLISSGLAYARDIWTGEKINDIDNPWLRRLNALSPLKVSEGPEEWRQWLREIGYRGTSKLLRDSSGKYEYSAEEREAVYELIGKQQPWKKLGRLMKSEKYKHHTGLMRAHRVTGDDLKYEKMEIDNKDLTLYDEIDFILKEAQEKAELQLLKERPDIFTSVKYQRLIDKYVAQGKIDRARELAEEEPEARAEALKQMEIRNIIQMKK